MLNILRLIVISPLIMFGLLAFHGVASLVSPPEVPSTSSVAVEDIKALLPQVEESTVKLHKGRRPMGTGFFISPTILVTNAHVARHSEFFRFEHQGRSMSAIVRHQMRNADLAILEVIDDKSRTWLSVGRTPVEKGDLVLAAGYPGRQGFVYRVSPVLGDYRSGYRSLRKSNGAAYTYESHIIEQSVGRGASGGPVINDRGEVIGVFHLQFGSLKRGAFIPLEPLRKLVWGYEE